MSFFEHVQSFVEAQNMAALPADHACKAYAADPQWGGAWLWFERAKFYPVLVDEWGNPRPEIGYGAWDPVTQTSEQVTYYFGWGEPMPRFATPADFDP